ncbi:hypothetical protein ACWELO_02430 [Streptomyces sp. NPDC004596]
MGLDEFPVEEIYEYVSPSRVERVLPQLDDWAPQGVHRSHSWWDR